MIKAKETQDQLPPERGATAAPVGALSPADSFRANGDYFMLGRSGSGSTISLSSVGSGTGQSGQSS